MAYGNQNYGNKGGKKQGTGLRLTGFFKTKRPGLFVGSISNKDLAPLIDKIKSAKGKELGLTFFLWKNDKQGGPLMSLNVDLERPQSERPKRRPIEEDDEDTGTIDNDDSLFDEDN